MGVKKILLVLIVLIVLASTLSIANAGIFGDNQENTTVSIGGIDFNIPAGFNEDKSKEEINVTEEDDATGGELITNSKSFTNGDNEVAILVDEYTKLVINDDYVQIQGEHEKDTSMTLNGVNGYLHHFDKSGNYYFYYAKDNKHVGILTNNKDIIGDFIIS